MTTENQMLNFILTMAFLGCAVCAATNNYLHWRGHARKQLFYLPKTGVPLVANWAWFIAMIGAAALKLAGLLPLLALSISVLSWIAAVQFYSIWYRQSLPKQTR